MHTKFCLFSYIFFFFNIVSSLSLSLLFCQSLWVLLFLSYNYQTFTITTPTLNTQYESKPTRFYIHSFRHRHRPSSSSSLSPSLRRITGRWSLLTLLGTLQFLLFFLNFPLIMLSFWFLAFWVSKAQFFPAGFLCFGPFKLLNSLVFYDLVRILVMGLWVALNWNCGCVGFLFLDFWGWSEAD